MNESEFRQHDLVQWLETPGPDGEYFAISRDFQRGNTDAIAAYRALSEQDNGFIWETGAASDAHEWMVGFDPYAVIEFDGVEFHVCGIAEETRVAVTGSLSETLRRLFARYSPLGANHVGGAFGYAAYEYAYLLDKFSLSEASLAGDRRAADFPLLYWQFCHTYVRYTARSRTLTISHIVSRHDFLGAGDAERRQRIEAIWRTLAERARTLDGLSGAPLPAAPRPCYDERRANAWRGFVPTLSRVQYEASVRRAKEYIASGDIFQSVLSLAMSKRTDVEPLDVLEILRALNRSPYMFYLAAGGRRITGCSPEMLIAVRGTRAYLNPIAGTVKRGADAAEDDRLAAGLLCSEKDRAEHVMLVDLGRNDLGKIARTDTVKVDEYMTIEKYSHVIHIVSRVSAELNDGNDAHDAFMAAFPAGTVSGAPKMRAMEIIDEIEARPRGPYAGAVGCFKFNGDLDTCITIRSLCFVDGRVTAQAGAGIVADSDPASEYQECLNKMMATIRAVAIAERASSDAANNKEVA